MRNSESEGLGPYAPVGRVIYRLGGVVPARGAVARMKTAIVPRASCPCGPNFSRRPLTTLLVHLTMSVPVYGAPTSGFRTHKRSRL
jgi:hypothetical protein